MSRRLDALLAYLFPSTPDDLMAIADAVGVTNVDDPIPYALTDRIPAAIPDQPTGEEYDDLVAHRTTVQQAAAIRANTLAGSVDFAIWEAEVSS